MTDTPEKKKNIPALIYSGLGALVGAFLVQYFFATPTFDEQLMRVAGEINKSCPIMVDQETRLDNTIAPNKKEFAYNYTLLNYTKEGVDVVELENYLKPRLTNTMRTNPDMKLFRDNGVTMIYNYSDKNGNFIHKITIRPEDYKE